MQEKEVLSKAVDTITRKPTTVGVPLKPNSRVDKLLMRVGLKKKVKTLEIYPLLVGNRKRIASRIIHWPDDILKQGLVKALMNPSCEDDRIYAAAIGIQNNRFEPDEKLLKFVEFQFDDTDMYQVLDAIFGKIDVQSFTKSIILMKGSNVLNVPESDAKNATIPVTN